MAFKNGVQKSRSKIPFKNPVQKWQQKMAEKNGGQKNNTNGFKISRQTRLYLYV